MCASPKAAAKCEAKPANAVARRDERREQNGFKLRDGRHGLDVAGVVYRRRYLHSAQGKRRRFLMPIFFAAVGTPLYDLAAGALLGANVYVMIRGGKGYLKGKKK